MFRTDRTDRWLSTDDIGSSRMLSFKDFFATAERVDRALAPALRSVWQLEHKPYAYQRYGRLARKDLLTFEPKRLEPNY